MDDHDDFNNVVDGLKSREIPYFDPEKMLPGGNLAEKLREAISVSSGCIFVATKKSLESTWCYAELGAFWGAGKPICVYIADPAVSGEKLPPQLQSGLFSRRITAIVASAEQMLSKTSANVNVWFAGDWSAYYYRGKEQEALDAGSIGTLSVASTPDAITMVFSIARSKAGKTINFRFSYHGQLFGSTQVVTTFTSIHPVGLPMCGSMTFQLLPATQKMIGRATYVDRQGQLATDGFLFLRPAAA